MADDRPERVKISYLKTWDFREIACDGVIGGPTPQGKLWMSFYTERMPIPKLVEHSLMQTDDGRIKLGELPTVLESREGVIRNVEFGVFMSIAVAEQLRDWLTAQLKEIGKQK